MDLEMQLRLGSEWNARVRPRTNEPLPAAELAALDADLAARGNAVIETPDQQAATIGELGRALGGYARISGHAQRPRS